MSKIYIASYDVEAAGVDTKYDHFYFVYDPDDNDPYDGDELIFRGGNESGASGFVLPGTNIEIEDWQEIADSEDKLGSDDPYTDRNYTEFQLTGQTPEEFVGTLSDWVSDLNTIDFDVNGNPIIDVEYTTPIEITENGQSVWRPALNSNTTIASAAEYAGYSLTGATPYEDGDSNNSRIGIENFAGAESNYSGSDGIHQIDLSSDSVYQNYYGDNTYQVTYNSQDTGRIYIIEDESSSTLDKIEVSNINPQDIEFRVSSDGDLAIFFPNDTHDDPSIVVVGQFAETVPKMNTLWVEPPGGGAPTVIPLNNPDNFPLLTPAPAKPDWMPDVLDPWDLAPDQSSPLTVDLDLDGIELTTFNEATTETFFDIDGDGFAEQTAWVDADDGLLVHDIDGSGTIDSVNELFGSPSTDGFALLALHDDNGDLLIDQYDDIWSDLEVWQDADGDALTDSAELLSLASLNIESIDLASVAESGATINGNFISHEGVLNYTNGTTADIVDAWFTHDNITTMYVGHDASYTASPMTPYLPELRGFGKLPNLSESMNMDETLRGMVYDLATTWSYASLADGADIKSDIRDILFRWGGVDGVSPTSRGSYVDAQRLEFLEQFLGEDFSSNVHILRSDEPRYNASAEIGDAFDALFEKLSSQLLTQIGAAEMFGGNVSYNPLTAEIDGTYDISQSAVADLEAAASEVGVNPEVFWTYALAYIEATKGLSNCQSAANRDPGSAFKRDPSDGELRGA